MAKQNFLAILLMAFFIVATFSFVLAAKTENESESAGTPMLISAQDNASVKNMTYGTCVSAAAKIKNECYASTKVTLKNCTATDANASKGKNVQCKTDYKSTMNNCKMLFKSSKKDCAKIKHNFFETARYALA